MLLNQLRSCQGKPSATKMDDFFMVGGSKNKIAIFLCMGPIFGQKNTKRIKERMAIKYGNISSVFLKYPNLDPFSNCIYVSF